MRFVKSHRKSPTTPDSLSFTRNLQWSPYYECCRQVDNQLWRTPFPAMVYPLREKLEQQRRAFHEVSLARGTPICEGHETRLGSKLKRTIRL